MKRRRFITLVGGAAAAWPLTARAQQSSNKIPLVGVLWHAGGAEEEDVYLSVLVKAFNDLGYVEGKNIRFDHRFPLRIRNGSGCWRENLSKRNPT
jgi:putative tryptophan/tyrosine transport system substrate-binding protein